MIKFFRKIRQNQVMENKTSKYFKYAIGEIILVVIGILIALSINNWNEQRKINAQVEELFAKSYSELAYNIKRGNVLINWYRDKSDNFYTIRRNTIKVLDFDDKKQNITDVMSSFRTMSISNSASNNLFSYNSKVVSETKAFIDELDDLYKSYKITFDDLDEEVEAVVDDHTAFVRDTKDWFGEINNEKFYKSRRPYILEDPIYKNWAAQYENLFSGHLNTIIRFKTKALKLYHKISEHFNFKKDSSLVGYIHTNPSLIGNYKGKFEFSIKTKGSNYYYTAIDKNRSDEGVIFFDSDTTAHAKIGYLKIKSDTLTITLGSNDKSILVKESDD